MKKFVLITFSLFFFTSFAYCQEAQYVKKFDGEVGIYLFTTDTLEMIEAGQTTQLEIRSLAWYLFKDHKIIANWKEEFIEDKSPEDSWRIRKFIKESDLEIEISLALRHEEIMLILRQEESIKHSPSGGGWTRFYRK